MSAANTYPNGVVSSAGAARIDAAPAGTLAAQWRLYSGGTPAGSWAIPVKTAGDVLYAACAVKSTGLAVGATVKLNYTEYDAAGSSLRSGTLQTLTIAAGPTQIAWPAAGTYNLLGSWATGANCAYVDLQILLSDATANSANGTLWIDNVLCWDAATTGQTSMAYHELRFNQSPAQVVLSGVLGDLPAPAHLALGTFLASWPTGSTLPFALGRRNTFSRDAVLVAQSQGFYGTALSPQATPLLDAMAFGGYYAQATVTSAGWNPRAFSAAPASVKGSYHLFSRFKSAQLLANLGNVQTRVFTQQLGNPWFGAAGQTDQLGTYAGPWNVSALLASNAWTIADSGLAVAPPFTAGALADLTQNFLVPRSQWWDLTGGGSVCQSNWQALLPIDGSLVVGVVNNPSNGPFAVTNQYLWTYLDGLLVNQGAAVVASSYSLENVAQPSPGHAGGGVGTQSSGAINVNLGAEPYLTLDPGIQNGAGSGVNQLVGYITDNAGSVLPLLAEVAYSPLYLWPR